MRSWRRSALAPVVLTVVAGAGLLGGCGAAAAGRTSAMADPPTSVAASPRYLDACAPAGLDSSPPCLQLTLMAIDRARAREGLGPMALPATFASLTVPEQVFVAVNRERVDRGLAPFATLSADLSTADAQAAGRAALPADPGPPYRGADSEWFGGLVNGLDVVYSWMYDDGPGSGVPGCSGQRTSGCWRDRHVVLDRFNGGPLAMGVGVDPTGDRNRPDVGGPSLAATLAIGPADPGPALLTWDAVLQATTAATFRPLSRLPAGESPAGIADPAANVAPDPDFTESCAPGGLDTSPTCVAAVLAAVDNARGQEGLGPMVLPVHYAQLSVPQQIFVAIDRERVDRGLAPFVGMVAALNRNAQAGADRANDPPDAGASYLLTDGEWAGGSANGLDAVYGWMYDDGPGSGNLDCPQRTSAGCWGHRKGILDDFGSGPALVMGAALNPTGDTYRGDRHGTSMAATLATAAHPPSAFTYTWAQALSDMPTGPGAH